MSEANHTPGPWRVSSHVRTIDGREVECDPDSGMFDACIMATNSEGRLIAIAGERGSKLNPYDYLPVAESAANMHLIAAAPDLLAVAERWQALFPGDQAGSPQFVQLIDDTRAAIAAAKGEQ